MIKLLNIIQTALKSILKNKKRNIFTMIGIIIGISSVITIMALGNGFKKSASDQFSGSGANKNQIIIDYFSEEMHSENLNAFNNTDIELVKKINGVESANIKEDKNQRYSTQIRSYLKETEITLQSKKTLEQVSKGKGFSDIDNELHQKIAIIDKKTSKDLFKGNSIGETIYINNIGFKIIGLKDDLMTESTVILPENTTKAYLSDLKPSMPQLEVKINDQQAKNKLAKTIVKTLNDEGSGNKNGTYEYTDMGEIVKSISSLFDSITYFIAAVAGISLFIAGIGVMNVMYISVAERTEEIAIRRAFGAKGRDIEFQFLLESVVLCVLGGIIGIILGISISKLIELVTPDFVQSVVTPSSILIAVGVSTFIGVVFGWIPARSASKKELLDIIR